MNSRIKVAVAVAVVAIGATVFVSSASAQMRGLNSFARGARPRVSARLVGPRIGFARTPYGGFFPGSLYQPPYFYPGYDYEQYEPIAAPAPAPPVVVVQSAPAPVPAAKPVDSLVLENRGGQWVRISNTGQIPAGAEPAAAGIKEAVTPPPRPKPTVLVFRDGHNEEVERYMINGNFIYVDANYWSTGLWTRKIAIAALDLPATQKLNEERGGKFILPSGPNVVILRP
jgi:hypothetical protein